LFTGDYQITISTEWNTNGAVFIRQPYPLPMEILDMVPEFSVEE
jgi:hypothetical protein